ncbi:putative reverse transcriptase, RNA-dependent DNA polymerase, partial [Tanacetum coccineum]
MEPKKVIQALEDPSWIEAMQEELLQFQLQKVWTLVNLPNGKRTIGTKWVFRNKKDERGIVVRNKARLVAQGYTQEEGIDYDEVFAPVARIETIMLFFAYASFMGFIVYQMDVKSAFLYGTIEEEVYVCQPPGFEDPQFPDKVYKVEKALYGLHQAPRSAALPWNSNKALIKDEVANITPKLSHLHAVKRIFRYLKGQPKLGLWYPRDSPFDLEAFSDSDYAGASLDRKSTTGGCQFLGKRLISWQCKKQTIVANSTTEAEYVAAANYCGQVLWIQNQMLDYGFNFMNTKIFIDNESTICIVKNPVFHFKTKHIEIRHHFIRDCYEKKLIQVIKIHADHNVADLLTKAFDTICKEWEDRMERAATTASSLNAEQDSDAQTRFETTFKKSNNPPLSGGYTLGSGEDSMKLLELMEICTKLSDLLQALIDKKKVIITKTSIRSDLHLEDAGGIDCLPTATIFEELEITNLKLRVKKLEKKAGLRTHKFEKLYKVGVTRRVEYSDDESLGAQEDVSNQGRSIEFIDKDAEVSLVDETHRRSDDAEMFDTDALIGNEVFAENDMIEKDQDVIPKEVSIAAPSTTVMPPPDITEVEITLAQTLAKLKSAKSKVVIQEPVQSTATTTPSTILKAKGITFRNAGESTTRTPTSVSSSSIKDKGKAKKDELESDKSKKVESSEKKAEGNRKKSIDEHEEADEDDEAEMKKHMEVVQDDEEIAIDAIPLATKPLIIVEYKIVKEGQRGFYHLIRADGSSNRYSSMIRMLQNISREDLETLWKLVKTKHGNTRPEDDYEKVFWGDLK